MAFDMSKISTKAVHKPPMIMLVGKSKMGKALAIDTPILSDKGWTTMEKIQPGDVVYDKDGKPTKVTQVTGIQKNRNCNLLRTRSGVEIVADDDHRWFTISRNRKQEVLTTKEIKETLATQKGSLKHAIPMCQPVQFGERITDIDPYILGYWLGNGCSTSGYVTVPDRDGEVFYHLGKLGKGHRDKGACSTITILGLKGKLAKYNLLNNKHIPDHFLWEADIESRKSLLAGLMDSDGYISSQGKYQCELTSTNHTLALQVCELLRSLGCKCKMGVGRATLYGKDCGAKYRVAFCPYFNPFRWSKFKYYRFNACDSKRKGNKDSIVSVEPVSSVPVKCIEVDSPSHTYLAGRDLLVTHNTSFCAGNRVKDGKIVEWGLNKPIILWLKGEEGANAIPVAKNTEPINTYDEVMEALAWLAKEEHDFQTVAIDSLTTLIEIVKTHVQKTEPELASDSKYNQYGNGNKKALVYHRQISDALTWLRDNKNMTVIMTGHIKPTPKDIPDPEKGLYAAWCADIPDAIYAMYDRSFDVVLYADTKDITSEKDIGMGNKQGKIVSLNNGERFLFTKKTLAHPSGGRGIYGHLKNEIPFDWASFQEAVAEAISNSNN